MLRVIGLQQTCSLFCLLLLINSQYRMYQQQQQQYEQQQRQYEQQQNGNYNNNYWAGSYYNSCSWYDFKCKYNAKKYQAMYQNQNGQQQGGGGQMVRAVIPGWYYLFGGQIEMEDDRQRQEMGMTSESEEGGMKFVYACSIILFTALTHVYWQGTDGTHLRSGNIWYIHSYESTNDCSGDHRD